MMKSFILDCSIAMSWCFEDEASTKADALLILLKEQEALVPGIWLLEIANVLHVAEQKNRITAKHTQTFFHLLNNLPIQIIGNQNLLYSESCLAIARQYHLSAYDAAYLELAMNRQIPLASFDKQLCLAAKKAGVFLL